jgi:hypothetical protein
MKMKVNVETRQPLSRLPGSTLRRVACNVTRQPDALDVAEHQMKAFIPKRSPLTVAAAMTMSLCAATLILGGCGSDSATDEADSFPVPTVYAFSSRLVPGSSSVFYGGQVNRHLLIAQLKGEIAGLTAKVDGGKAYNKGDVTASLAFYYSFDKSVGGAVPHGVATVPPPLQQTWADLGGKDLAAKTAGNDAVGQHRDWANVGVIGWPGKLSADALVRAWMAELDALVVDRAAGKIALGGDGKPLAEAYITASGHNLAELMQKFLLGAVAYSQGADDYLDDDTDGKGLRSDHSKADEDGPEYTALEHAWDEGFGYFGAAADYSSYSDAELAGKGGDAGRQNGVFDSNGDGKIDLFSEANFGHALNCSKRDHGAVGRSDIDLSGAAFKAFLRGRARITATQLGGADATMRAALAKDRDAALLAWEQCISATIVHYINEVLADVALAGSAEWSHSDAAGHWSELKGFALSLQFSRLSMLNTAQIIELHAKIGDAPVLGNAAPAAIATAKSNLIAARALVMAAYGFDASLRGGDEGKGGW